MKRVTIKRNDGSESEYACNSASEGAFIRQYDGSFSQIAGTAQTPIFKNARHLLRWLNQDGEIIHQFGWE